MDSSVKEPDQFSSDLKGRFFTWRIARRMLLTIAFLVTLVAVFYTEENWRGKRAWDRCRRELEARGRVFDWSTRIPPPVPEAANFFGDSQMADWFAGRRKNDLSQRLDDPRTHGISINGTNIIQTVVEARDYLSWSDQFSEDFDAIRAALKRPYARIDCDYTQPMTVQVPNFLSIRNLVQTLSQRAHCYLLLGEPEQALRDLTLIHDFCRVLDCPPSGKPITLVGAMINVAVTGLYASTIGEGLRTHSWRDPQLSALEEQLGEVHLEKALVETFTDEPMFSLRTIETSSRTELIQLFQGSPASKQSSLLLKYAPRGWFYQYMVFHVRLNERFVSGFAATNHTVSPRKIDEAGRVLKQNIDHVTAYNFLACWWIPNWVKAVERYAAIQTISNEGVVACALERYRLNHNDYPESLNQLVPEFMSTIPSDLIGGQPLKYRRTGIGDFVLYSLGWNESDDGGKAGKDIAGGDWVWNESSEAITK